MKKLIIILSLGFSISLLGQQKPKTDTIHGNKPFVMDEVIVSSAFKKLQSQTVMKVEHQSIKDLAQNGATTLIDGLATIPGVSQISTGIAIGKPVIRGLSANRVLVYSQGVRVENQQFGDEHGLGLNDSGIESVEVIKGPASLLYGSDAMGGVLYFNPEKFADANQFKADFNQKLFSNTNGTKTDFGLKYSKTNWKFLARANYDTHSDYQIPNGSRVTNTRFNEKEFKTAIGYVTEKFTSIIRYNFNSLDIGIPNFGIETQTATKQTDFPKQAVSNNLMILNNVLRFKNSKLDFNFGYIYNDRKEFEENDTPNLHWKLKTVNYDIKYYLPKSNKLETIIGIQGINQKNTNYGDEFLIPNAEIIDNGIFATSIYQFDKSSIQFGLRFDNRKITILPNGLIGDVNYFEELSKSYNSTNGSIGFKTEIAKNIPLRINFASGFRAPNLSELSSNGVHEGTNRYEIGNANLKTEQNIQLDLNLEYKNSHFEFFANGFYNNINNFIYISPTGNTDIDGNYIYNYIQDNAALIGGEMGLHFHPHPLDWLHFESSFESVTGKKQNGDHLPLIPANKWNSTLKIDLKPTKWLENCFVSVNISHFLNQNKIGAFETQTNDYTIINLALFGKIKFGKTNLETTINANNLFNKSYISHLSRLKNEGIPNIGRNFVFGINFKI